MRAQVPYLAGLARQCRRADAAAAAAPALRGCRLPAGPPAGGRRPADSPPGRAGDAAARGFPPAPAPRLSAGEQPAAPLIAPRRGAPASQRYGAAEPGRRRPRAYRSRRPRGAPPAVRRRQPSRTGPGRRWSPSARRSPHRDSQLAPRPLPGRRRRPRAAAPSRGSRGPRLAQRPRQTARWPQPPRRVAGRREPPRSARRAAPASCRILRRAGAGGPRAAAPAPPAGRIAGRDRRVPGPLPDRPGLPAAWLGRAAFRAAETGRRRGIDRQPARRRRFSAQRPAAATDRGTGAAPAAAAGDLQPASHPALAPRPAELAGPDRPGRAAGARRTGLGPSLDRHDRGHRRPASPASPPP